MPVECLPHVNGGLSVVHQKNHQSDRRFPRLQVFGVDVHNPPQDVSGLAVEPARNTPLSQRINAVLAALRARAAASGSASFQQCFVVRQGSPLEAAVVPYFVEDRSVGQLSYSEYLASFHKAVMSK